VTLPSPYYQDSAVTIYHANSGSILHLLCADVLITDPPFGVELGSSRTSTGQRSRWRKRDKYASYDDTFVNFATALLIIETALRHAPRGAVCIAQHRLQMLPPFDAIGGAFLPAGIGLTPFGFNNLMLAALYGSCPHHHRGARNTIIQIKAESGEYRSLHPCPKPYRLMTHLVGLCSSVGETILDPFAGSVTTLRAAKDLGRKAIGIEIEERYCEVAAKRMRQEVLPFHTATPGTQRIASLFDKGSTL
jgi:site-specific DNA-methyltransferase (adenine-specific)